MEIRISATRAARQFSDLINRVRYSGDEFVVERSGEPVCRIVPAGPKKITVREFVERLHSLPRPDRGLARDVRKAQRQFKAGVPKSVWPS